MKASVFGKKREERESDREREKEREREREECYGPICIPGLCSHISVVAFLLLFHTRSLSFQSLFLFVHSQSVQTHLYVVGRTIFYPV